MISRQGTAPCAGALDKAMGLSLAVIVPWTTITTGALSLAPDVHTEFTANPSMAGLSKGGVVLELTTGCATVRPTDRTKGIDSAS